MGERLASILSSLQTPALVTVLLGMVGWNITHTVDRVVSSPIAEYSFRTLGTSATGTTKFVVELANLSLDEEFGGTEIYLRKRDGLADVTFRTPPKVIPRPPVYWGGKDAVTSFSPDGVALTIPYWPPKGELEVNGFYDGHDVPIIQAVLPNKAVQMIERNTLTRLVRYEIWILVGLTVLWLVKWTPSVGPLGPVS